MRVKIGKFEIECSPEEMAELISRSSSSAEELIFRRSGNSNGNVTVKTEYADASYLKKISVPVSEAVPKHHVKTEHAEDGSFRGKHKWQQLGILTRMLKARPTLAKGSMWDVAQEYRKVTGAKPNWNYLKKNFRKACKSLDIEYDVPENAKVRGDKHIRKIVAVFRENPNLENSSDNAIRKAYMKRYGLKGVNYRYFFDNIKKAKRLYLNVERRRLLSPSIEGESINSSERVAQTASTMPNKTWNWEDIEEKKEKVRTITPYGYVSRSMVEEIIRKMPERFSADDVMHRVAEKLGKQYLGRKRFIDYPSAYRHLRNICGIPSIRGAGGHPKTKSSVFNNPFRKAETIDSVMKLPSMSDEPSSAFASNGGSTDTTNITVERNEGRRQESPSIEEYEPVVISRDTLDVLMNSVLSFGADTLVGLKTKNGSIVQDNDARYSFRHMMENFTSLQRTYPGKKLSISGSGQYKTIEVRG